jgi:hypothetical protein
VRGGSSGLARVAPSYAGDLDPPVGRSRAKVLRDLDLPRLCDPTGPLGRSGFGAKMGERVRRAREDAEIIRRAAAASVAQAREQKRQVALMRTENEQLRQRLRERFPGRFR